MAGRGLTVRWSLRDLRHRWVLVGAIALIIAVGTGTTAALGATADWRRQSNDASYAVTLAHDVRVRLADGTFTAEGTLAAAVAGVEGLAVAEERLVVAAQVDASTPGDAILVRGRVVGAPARDVDLVDVVAGDASGPVLERQFADHWGLPATGTLTLAGGTDVHWTGLGTAPEYFLVTGDRSSGGFLAGASFAVLFTSLPDAQALTGHPGMVNDLVARAAPGVGADELAERVRDALGGAGLAVGTTVETLADDEAHHILYQDIEGDQKVWNVVSALVLGGAAIAVFNLVSRVVEAQRREIGIGMALGVARARLAARPLLLGVEIALVGVVAGIAMGLALTSLLRSVYVEFLPLPVWETPFGWASYARAGALGIALPVVATIWPVWRAVRVEPVDAIRSTALTASGRAGRLGTRLRLPGRTWFHMPVRNLVRTPRRTALTAVAIGAAVCVMIGIVGMLDTFSSTIDDAEQDLVRSAPDRVTAALDTIAPAGSATVSAIEALPSAGRVDLGLRLPAVFAPDDGGDGFDAVLELWDVEGGMWAPRVSRGGAPTLDAPLLLSEKAAEDLGVLPGDAVTVTYPRREGLGYRMVTGPLRVAGTHATPLRAQTWLDDSAAALFGMEGLVNIVRVDPAAGSSTAAVQRDLFGVAGVGSLSTTQEASKAFDDALAQFQGILRTMQGVLLLLALLIAFNSTSIATDERRREHATMFAFGLRRSTVLAMAVAENAVLGLLGTLVGLGGGALVLRWMIDSVLAGTVPDIGLEPSIAPATVVASLVMGIVVVALAPLFTMRRLRRMDIPSTLRVVE